MRDIPVQGESIRVAAVGGERRYIRVSGVARVRLRWLFRNFNILDFSVLNRKQRQLIAQMWPRGTPASPREDPGYVIGTVEGFSPQLSQPVTPARLPHAANVVQLHVPLAEPIRPTKPAIPAEPNLTEPAVSRPRRSLSHDIAASALLCVLVACTLGATMYLIDPKHRIVEQSGAASKYVNPITPVVHGSTDATASATGLPDSSGVLPHAPSTPVPGRMESAPTLRDHATAVLNTATPLPDAMAADASSPEVKPRPPRTRMASRPEVVVRVSVDHQGRVLNLHMLSGDPRQLPAAMNAARRWHFQPCSEDAGCEHMLKYTDHGDASSVQLIN